MSSIKGGKSKRRQWFPCGDGSYYLNCKGDFSKPPDTQPSPDQISVYDTEADLPTPAWGKFAVVKEVDPQGRHYFYVGTNDGWKRAELEPIND